MSANGKGRKRRPEAVDLMAHGGDGKAAANRFSLIPVRTKYGWRIICGGS
jgi:hypothetical protein